MKVVRFSHLFWAVTALMWGIISGGFAAELSVVSEEQSAWLVSAEAQAEQSLDRAVLDFDSSLIDGDVLSVASPWLRVFKLGGNWQSLAPESGPDWLAARTAWHVPQEKNAALCLILDRAFLGQAELELQIEYYDGPGELFVDLVSESEEVIASSAEYGNLLEGTGEVVVKAMNIPLAEYPAARGIYLRGQGGEGLPELGQGGLFVLGAALLVKKSSALGGDEVPDQPMAHRDDSPYRLPAGRLSEVGRGVSAEPVVGSPRRAKPGAGLRAKPVSAKSIPQFVQSLLMTDSAYQISRDVLSGGGGRQIAVAANLILEATFAQASAIGFSSNSSIILHAGYQQTDDQSLAITNVSVIPLRFNPSLGEVATLSYVLSTRPRGISLEVSNAVTFAAFSLTNNMPQGPGLRTFVWDGKDTNGNLLAPADWTFRILARDYQGRVLTNADALVTIRPAGTMPVILAVDDNPDPFCPTVDVANAISYTTAESQNRDLDVTVAIEDAAGNPVANFSTNNQTPGSYTLNWDGAGATRNGLYVYRITARRSQGGQAANERTGSIILSCGQDCVTSADGNVRVCYQPGAFTLAIMPASPGQLSSASYALLAQGGLLFQSGVYDIQATPSTGFDPPAVLTFEYDSAIRGAIGGKLELRRYDEASTSWVAVANQFVDYANNQIIAEVTNLSLFALFAVEQPAVPGVLSATVRLEPEVLKVNPGILTAFVSLPEGFTESGIVAATCDGAASESMALSADGTEMVIKFRRQAIEAALAEQGQVLDTHFVVEGAWQGPESTIPFVGEDDIARILN